MNWPGIIGALIIFVITLGMVLFLALRELWRKRHCGILGVVFSIFFAVGMLRVMATKPNPGGPSMAPRRDAPSMVAPADDSTNEVSHAAWETTLAFSAIDMTPTNLTVRASCPAGFFDHDVILDCMASQSLTNSYYWVTNLTLTAGCTNLDFVLTPMLLCGATNFPPQMFFRIRERASTASTMLDTDGDGLPDIYELRNGTNPYVPDYELAPKIVVDADAVSMPAALEASAPYSIIEIPSGETQVSSSLVFPNHPVLVTGPRDGYAVLRSSSSLGAFMFDQGQNEQTLIRNLYLVLEKRGDFQVGFWCGGNLAWSGVGSNPMFQNVVVRMPRPETQYIGWLFYRDNGGLASLSNCLVDAQGAVNVRGVETGNGPEVLLQDFSCLNFPTSGIQKLARTFTLGDNGVTNQIRQVGLEATVFVDLTPGVDSDGDGYTNEEEVYTLHTNPWLADSDGDGLSDPLELFYGSDPMDVRSFPRKIYVSVTNTTDVAGSSVYVSWGRSGVGIEATPLTNTVERSTSCEFDVPPSQGNVYVTAFRDLNGNGVFDADYDIVRSETISDLTEVSHLRFAFGDVDGDGIVDTQERLDGTDPYSSLSLKINQRVVLTNNDPSDSLDTYYFYGLSPLDCVSGPYALVGRSTSFYVSQVATNRYLYLTAYRDVNGNGVFDTGVDLHSVFTVANNTQSSEFTIGDTDGDKILDSIELTEGTDPTNRLNYCYHPTLTVRNIFSTTNILECQFMFGTNAVGSMMMVTNSVMYFDPGHFCTTNSEVFSVRFWDDINHNGELDADEPHSIVTAHPTGHETQTEAILQYGGFDADRNGLLDWWEASTGLSNESGNRGPMDDSDGDGLVNYHEYLMGCDPMHPDGSNTLLSVCARSIDSRIRSKDPVFSVELLSAYLENAADLTFQRNVNSWLSDVDLSSMGVWSEQNPFNQRAPVAVSRNHVMMSTHWPVGVGKNLWFVDRNGCVVSNEIDAIRNVTISGCSAREVDVCVGLLKYPLPETVSIASVFPATICDKLGDGMGLPVIQINQEKEARVAEVVSLELQRTRHVCYTSDVQPWRIGFAKAVRSGDSGSPTFALVDDRIVLLGLHHSTASDPAYWAMIDEIQSAMDYLSPGEENGLSVLDVDNYPDLVDRSMP